VYFVLVIVSLVVQSMQLFSGKVFKMTCYGIELNVELYSLVTHYIEFFY